MDKPSKVEIDISRLNGLLRGASMTDPYIRNFLNALHYCTTQDDWTVILANVLLSYSEANTKLLKVCIDLHMFTPQPFKFGGEDNG